MDIEKELALALGRINGVHAAVITIARGLPSDVAQRAATELASASERIQADALASPLPDLLVAEMHRVTLELTRVLQTASKDRQ